MRVYKEGSPFAAKAFLTNLCWPQTSLKNNHSLKVLLSERRVIQRIKMSCQIDLQYALIQFTITKKNIEGCIDAIVSEFCENHKDTDFVPKGGNNDTFRKLIIYKERVDYLISHLVKLGHDETNNKPGGLFALLYERRGIEIFLKGLESKPSDGDGALKQNNQIGGNYNHNTNNNKRSSDETSPEYSKKNKIEKEEEKDQDEEQEEEEEEEEDEEEEEEEEEENQIRFGNKARSVLQAMTQNKLRKQPLQQSAPEMIERHQQVGLSACGKTTRRSSALDTMVSASNIEDTKAANGESKIMSKEIMKSELLKKSKSENLLTEEDVHRFLITKNAVQKMEKYISTQPLNFQTHKNMKSEKVIAIRSKHATITTKKEFQSLIEDLYFFLGAGIRMHKESSAE